MDNGDDLTWRIWQAEGMGKALLIGGILFYIPLVNLLLLGWWGLWIRRLSSRRGGELPDWADWRAILKETVRLMPLFVVGVALPVGVASVLVWGLGGLLKWLSMDFFAATLAWIPMTAVAVLVVPVFVVSLNRLNRGSALKTALNVPDTTRVALAQVRGWLFPVLQFFGLLLLGWPVLGFAVSAGMPVLLAQLSLQLRRAEAQASAVDI
jgi:hypothetical protein